MHSSTIFAVFALALTATALPSPNGGGGSSPPPPTCSTSAANKCCNGFYQETIGGILSTIGLGCTNIVGSTCTSGNAACCDQSSSGLVNVNLCQIAL